MKPVFEEIFARAGTTLEQHLDLSPLSVLARHAWPDGSSLDLFADPARSRDAIGRLAGCEAVAGFDRFCTDSRDVFNLLEASYLRASRPNPLSLTHRIGYRRIPSLVKIRPFESLWRALGDYFPDPRLRQLYGRYATYCGSSPYAAPATLMLIAHLEQLGVWRINGGMHRLAEALQQIAENNGASFRYDAEVAEILTLGNQVTGVALDSGERIAGSTLVCNFDANALAEGRHGTVVAGAVKRATVAQRSLSAMTWCMVARAEGMPLSHHTVLFSSDYRAEFRDLFERGRTPRSPTVYVCAQDRSGDPEEHIIGPERLLCLINAPATADGARLSPSAIAACEKRAALVLKACGVRLVPGESAIRVTTPAEFAHRFPGSGGAIYGRATHGWRASFSRPGAETRVRGLYLVGGSVHPGPGIPMVALSAKRAVDAILRRDRRKLP